jgi:hypothetical protein
MTAQKGLKRFGILVFSVGFALMIYSEPFYMLGGILVILSIWIDMFVHEQIDAYYEEEMKKGHYIHGSNLAPVGAAGIATT